MEFIKKTSGNIEVKGKYLKGYINSKNIFISEKEKYNIVELEQSVLNSIHALNDLEKTFTSNNGKNDNIFELLKEKCLVINKLKK
jgi:hypothetical protein